MHHEKKKELSLWRKFSEAAVFSFIKIKIKLDFNMEENRESYDRFHRNPEYNNGHLGEIFNGAISHRRTVLSDSMSLF